MHQTDAQSRPGKPIPIDLSQPLSLTIHIPSGNVSVRAVERSDVLVGYGSPGYPEDLGDESGLTIDVRGNHIEIRPDPRLDAGWSGIGADFDLEAVVGQIAKAFRGGGPFFSPKSGAVRIGSGGRSWPDLAIEVPRAITGRVEIHSASGDALVEGFSGEIAVNTMSGDLRVVRTVGPLMVQTASGDLLVEDASGKLTMHAASGDARITSSRIDGFDIQTASGDVHLDTTLVGDGPFRAQTANGDVHLLLRRPTAAGEEPAAALAFHTVSGDAHVSPPFRQIDRRRWQSGSGNSGPRIGITTVNGDLTAAIAATDEHAFVAAPSPAVFVDETPPAAPAPEDQPQGEQQRAGVSASPEATPAIARDTRERLAVLEAVERGEIDIEEALRRLDAADVVANS
jgi:hypothetical protein